MIGVGVGVGVALMLVLSGCTDTEEGPAPSAPASEPSATAPAEPSPTEKTQDTDLADAEFALSWQDALAQARQNFDGELYSIELDWEQAQCAYTVKLVSDTEEYEIEIGADSGDVLDEETEAMDGDDIAEKTSEIVDVDRVVPWSDALQTAKGVADGRVDEWKLEGTGGGAKYEFDIDTGDGEDVEISVDAYSGELLGEDD